MQITNEGYLLDRNVVRVRFKKNKLLEWMKMHRIALGVTTFFVSLILIEGILLNWFIKLLITL